jgi:hypothetical protein
VLFSVLRSSILSDANSMRLHHRNAMGFLHARYLHAGFDPLAEFVEQRLVDDAEPRSQLFERFDGVDGHNSAPVS